jgi:branched-chain amino acid aminotransferase
VRDGRIATPQARYVLPGISRQTVIELATGLDIPCVERDLDLYDGVTAAEVFLTSTSLCICPVRTLNGHRIGEGVVPGPITRRLTEAFCAHVGTDFVAQYLGRLPGAP